MLLVFVVLMIWMLMFESWCVVFEEIFEFIFLVMIGMLRVLMILVIFGSRFENCSCFLG